VIVFLSPALAALAIAIGGLGFISSFVAVFLLIVWRKTKPIIGEDPALFTSHRLFFYQLQISFYCSDGWTLQYNHFVWFVAGFYHSHFNGT
jgi:hypothetical protein